MTSHRELFAALAAPFARDEVKTRPQGGRQLSYVTARTVMNRLDEALGPECWWDDYVPTEHSVICRLTIRLPDGQILTKSDAGGYAGMADPGDDDKSGFSDAFKRAAVKFGVGRYLYRDGVPKFDGDAPAAHPEPEPAPPPPIDRPSNDNGHGDPRTGRALFAWLKKQEEEHGLELIKPLIARGKKSGLPYKMTEWPDEVIARAHAEACRMIADSHGGRNDLVTQEDADRWQEGRE